MIMLDWLRSLPGWMISMSAHTMMICPELTIGLLLPLQQLKLQQFLPMEKIALTESKYSLLSNA